MGENDSFEAWARSIGWTMLERYAGDYGDTKDGEYRHPQVHTSHIAWAACSAAKDREIAELRAHRDAAVIDYARVHEIALQAERERDEARECVKRLYIALSAAKPDLARYASREVLRDALYALRDTPEHLR